MKPTDQAALTLRIRLNYPDVDTFIERYSSNISHGGMFIQSKMPQEKGTVIHFDVVLRDGRGLLKGEGRVIWTKEYDMANPTQAHGMGVRFVSLDDESQAMVDRVLAYKKANKVKKAEQAKQAVEAAEQAGDEPGVTAPDLAAAEEISHPDQPVQIRRLPSQEIAVVTQQFAGGGPPPMPGQVSDFERLQAAEDDPEEFVSAEMIEPEDEEQELVAELPEVPVPPPQAYDPNLQQPPPEQDPGQWYAPQQQAYDPAQTPPPQVYDPNQPPPQQLYDPNLAPPQPYDPNLAPPQQVYDPNQPPPQAYDPNLAPPQQVYDPNQPPPQAYDPSLPPQQVYDPNLAPPQPYDPNLAPPQQVYDPNQPPPQPYDPNQTPPPQLYDPNLAPPPQPYPAQGFDPSPPPPPQPYDPQWQAAQPYDSTQAPPQVYDPNLPQPQQAYDPAQTPPPQVYDPNQPPAYDPGLTPQPAYDPNLAPPEHQAPAPQPEPEPQPVDTVDPRSSDTYSDEDSDEDQQLVAELAGVEEPPAEADQPAEADPEPEPAPEPAPVTVKPWTPSLEVGGNGVGQLLSLSHQELDQILTEAGITEQQVESTLQRVKSEPISTEGLEELDQLLAAPAVVEADLDAALSMLGMAAPAAIQRPDIPAPTPPPPPVERPQPRPEPSPQAEPAEAEEDAPGGLQPVRSVFEMLLEEAIEAEEEQLASEHEQDAPAVMELESELPVDFDQPVEPPMEATPAPELEQPQDSDLGTLGELEPEALSAVVPAQQDPHEAVTLLDASESADELARAVLQEVVDEAVSDLDDLLREVDHDDPLEGDDGGTAKTSLDDIEPPPEPDEEPFLESSPAPMVDSPFADAPVPTDVPSRVTPGMELEAGQPAQPSYRGEPLMPEALDVDLDAESDSDNVIQPAIGPGEAEEESTQVVDAPPQYAPPEAADAVGEMLDEATLSDLGSSDGPIKTDATELEAEILLDDDLVEIEDPDEVQPRPSATPPPLPVDGPPVTPPPQRVMATGPYQPVPDGPPPPDAVPQPVVEQPAQPDQPAEETPDDPDKPGFFSRLFTKK